MKQLKLIIKLLQAILDLLHQAILLGTDVHSPRPWMSKQEVMDYLRITESTYYRWLEMGLLEPRGPEGQDRYFKEDLQTIFEKRKHRKALPPRRGK